MKNGVTHLNQGKPISQLIADDFKNVDEAYICTDFNCNLNCPHCTLKNVKVNHKQIDNIVNTINFLKNANPNVSFTIFGGEPSLLSDDLLIKLKNTIGNNNYSVSTNLIKFSDTFLQLLKDADLPDTSWNPHRFPSLEILNMWKNNLQLLKNNDIKFELMITLTSDLIAISPKDFIKMIEEWGVKSVKLEFMIGDEELNPSDVDEWLVKLYEEWKKNIAMEGYSNVLFKRIEDVILRNTRWEGNCEKTVTIMPNGNIKERCPYYEYSITKPECLTCEYYKWCEGGCPLQEKCVFPKKLFERIKKDLDV